MNGSGGSSYGYGCKGQCEGSAYYGCNPCANHGGGGRGADIVVSVNGNGMIVVQWDDGIKSTLSSYSASATNF